MNYVFQGNMNFSNELMKLVSEDAKINIEENVCLISGEILLENFIELSCGHKFNYTSIINELINQRKKNRLETHTITIKQIKCPYCRNLHNGILPYYNGYEKIKNVNWSSTNKKIIKKCIGIIKSGKRKGEPCGCAAKYGDFCGRHKNQKN
jgi:hypothetical protein